MIGTEINLKVVTSATVLHREYEPRQIQPMACCGGPDSHRSADVPPAAGVTRFVGASKRPALIPSDGGKSRRKESCEDSSDRRNDRAGQLSRDAECRARGSWLLRRQDPRGAPFTEPGPANVFSPSCSLVSPAIVAGRRARKTPNVPSDSRGLRLEFGESMPESRAEQAKVETTRSP